MWIHSLFDSAAFKLDLLSTDASLEFNASVILESFAAIELEGSGNLVRVLLQVFIFPRTVSRSSRFPQIFHGIVHWRHGVLQFTGDPSPPRLDFNGDIHVIPTNSRARGIRPSQTGDG